MGRGTLQMNLELDLFDEYFSGEEVISRIYDNRGNSVRGLGLLVPFYHRSPRVIDAVRKSFAVQGILRTVCGDHSPVTYGGLVDLAVRDDAVYRTIVRDHTPFEFVAYGHPHRRTFLLLENDTIVSTSLGDNGFRGYGLLSPKERELIIHQGKELLLPKRYRK